MNNVNCLEGMRCPECDYNEMFYIVASVKLEVYDNGTDNYTDVEWEDDSHCQCGDCGWFGLVKEFKDAGQNNTSS